MVKLKLQQDCKDEGLFGCKIKKKILYNFIMLGMQLIIREIVTYFIVAE